MQWESEEYPIWESATELIHKRFGERIINQWNSAKEKQREISNPRMRSRSPVAGSLPSSTKRETRRRASSITRPSPIRVITRSSSRTRNTSSVSNVRVTRRRKSLSQQSNEYTKQVVDQTLSKQSKDYSESFANQKNSQQSREQLSELATNQVVTERPRSPSPVRSPPRAAVRKSSLPEIAEVLSLDGRLHKSSTSENISSKSEEFFQKFWKENFAFTPKKYSHVVKQEVATEPTKMDVVEESQDPVAMSQPPEFSTVSDKPMQVETSEAVERMSQRELMYTRGAFIAVAAVLAVFLYPKLLSLQ